MLLFNEQFDLGTHDFITEGGIGVCDLFSLVGKICFCKPES